MICGNSAEAGTEQRVRPGSEDLQAIIAAPQAEAQPCALGAANPVGLHGPDGIGPALQLVERIEQGIGKIGNAEHPLRQQAPLD